MPLRESSPVVARPVRTRASERPPWWLRVAERADSSEGGRGAHGGDEEQASAIVIFPALTASASAGIASRISSACAAAPTLGRPRHVY